MRSLTEILKQESPISLAREAVWRTRKNWTKKKVLAQLSGKASAISFRAIPYYKPDPSAFHETTRNLVTAFADEICAGRYPFLGYGTRNLGMRPRWNLDFVCGLDWPAVPLENRNCMRFDGSDVKVPYELSRLQFLPILGKSFVLTGQNRYRETAKHLLSSWIQDNPFGIGVNWSLAMEAALRGMSICFLLNLLSPFRMAEKSWLAAAIQSLWQHLIYVEAHIEFSHLISSNHYLGNIVGLYCLASFLDGPRMAAKRDFYRRRIEGELARQVYDDGGDYEGSTGYHVLVTQMFTTALLLMRASGDTPRPRFLERVRRMHRLLVAAASPSGQIPHVGDCDDGRVEILLDDLQQLLSMPVPQRNSLRISNLMGLGKGLFDEGCGSTEDAKWYGFGEPAEPLSTVPTPPRVEVFPHSGVAIARTGPAEILFFVVPNGIHGKGSHNHNDKLSVILRLDGEEVLCDSGTGSYTRDVAFRNRFRVTSAHNTVMVDGKEQCAIELTRAGLFRLGTEATVRRIKHVTEGDIMTLQASHSGYSSLGITHSRTIRLQGDEGKAYLEDHLTGTGLHQVELNFHAAPPWRPAQITNTESGARCLLEGPRQLEIFVSAPCVVHMDQGETEISMTYGATTPASRITFTCQLELPASITTQLAWAS
jgi:Heparinase II/III-like protein/Heparinase II/III N-terminus